MQVLRVDTATAKGMTGNGQFGHTIVVQVAGAADVGIEAHVQVQPRAGGFILDGPARLVGLGVVAAAIQGGGEHHPVDLLLGFLVADLVVQAAEYQHRLAIAVAKVHVLHRHLHAQRRQRRGLQWWQQFETLLVAGAERGQAGQYDAVA
ncbi:hypothetical protein D3C77_590660 [compost metagenome]